METTEALRLMLGSLAKEDGVFGRVARADARPVEEHVHDLVLEAQEAWASSAVAGAQGPASPSEVGAALRRIPGDRAVAVTAYLSAGDLVFPGRMRRDAAHARRAAERVARLLGWNTAWWTNIEPSDTGHRWTPVTRHTFDGVVAGVGDEAVFVLLQVGDD
ncbi:hypothetical protein [Streptomyces sp. DSM 41921]|uniref:PucR family transcriptional regulator n=1 Tax=Streptomyces dubilierae TaxID=3075533 RepID=A0ABU2P7W7_9ACTN|nr:hypothetical protein [Streptomyces sp. DSM 41921]MDT0388238.1 hypothetical protein [Streptomyces sp. DSM 41921]